MNNKYIIKIDKTDEVPQGVLVLKNQTVDKADVVVPFSPINILGDIFSSVFSENLVDTVVNFNMYNDFNYQERMRNIYRGFDVAFGIENYDPCFLGLEQYYQVLSNLLVFMCFQNSVNLHDFNCIYLFFGSRYKWKAFLIDDIEQYRKDKWQTENLKELDPDEYNELKYTLNKKTHICVFSCDTKADVIFSILQYLLLSGYCFKQCLHCQKFYAFNAPDNGFCKRKSPFTGFEKYECEDAVKQIKSRLQEKKRAVCSNIISKSGTAAPKKIGVENVFDELKSRIKSKPNIENLRLCEAFLTNDEMKTLFYSTSMHSSLDSKTDAP